MTRLELAKELKYWLKRVPLGDMSDHEILEFQHTLNTVNHIIDDNPPEQVGNQEPPLADPHHDPSVDRPTHR